MPRSQHHKHKKDRKNELGHEKIHNEHKDGDKHAKHKKLSAGHETLEKADNDESKSFQHKHKKQKKDRDSEVKKDVYHKEPNEKPKKHKHKKSREPEVKGNSWTSEESSKHDKPKKHKHSKKRECEIRGEEDPKETAEDSEKEDNKHKKQKRKMSVETDPKMSKQKHKKRETSFEMNEVEGEDSDDGGIFLFSGSKKEVSSIPEEQLIPEAKESLSKKFDSILVEFTKDKLHNLPNIPALPKKAYKKLTDEFRLGDNSINSQSKKRKIDEIAEDSTTKYENERPKKKAKYDKGENEQIPKHNGNKQIKLQGRKDKRKSSDFDSPLRAHLLSLGLTV